MINRPQGYWRWHSMINRCYCKTAKDFVRYGARGISVCDRWRFGEDGKSGLECYLADMGHKPKGLSLDRIDNDGPYSPENCKWVKPKQQSRNRKDNRIVEAWGARMPLVEALERAGIRKQSFYGRIRRGMSVREALETTVSRPAALVQNRRNPTRLNVG